VENFGADGRPIADRHGIARWTADYDLHGRRLTWRRYDANGRRLAADAG